MFIRGVSRNYEDAFADTFLEMWRTRHINHGVCNLPKQACVLQQQLCAIVGESKGCGIE
jgi:hypothetical protein